MVLLVCGCRDYTDVARLEEVLDDLHQRIKVTSLVHGGASGVHRQIAEPGWRRA